MPLIQGVTGPQNASGDGQAPLAARFGRQGDQIASELHARYYEQTVRGNMYFAATQALVTTTVGLATTYTGLALSNPTTSRFNIVLNKVSLMQSVIQATQIEAFAIAVGYNGTTNVTHTTPVAVHNALQVGNTGVGLADTSATLPTAPFYAIFLTNTQTATQNSTVGVVDLEGSIILPPGGYACFVTPAQASVAGMWFSFSWEEVPVL